MSFRSVVSASWVLIFAVGCSSSTGEEVPGDETGTGDDTGAPLDDSGTGPDGAPSDAASTDTGTATDAPPADTKPVDPPPVPGAVYGAKCTGWDANEQKAWEEIAIVRGKLGMGALDCIDPIMKAGRAHSNYIQANGGGLTHTEDASKPGYTGVQFWDRMKAAGFTGPGSAMFEVVHSIPEAHGAILGEGGWINTLYHRIPFVSYGAKGYGFGASTKASTIDFSSGGAKPAAGALATWPVDGDTAIWTTFRCASEVPNPLPGQTFAGYPVSLTATGALAITEHTIDGGTGALEHVMLMKGADSTGLIPADQVYLIPKAPLKVSTKYTVKIAGTSGGAAFSKTWVFTTGTK